METYRSTNLVRVPTRFDESLNGMDLSVCIVTFQARDLLRDCLNSLYTNTRAAFEVIVVDNGSQDGVEAMLAEDFPAVHFIQNHNNLGYTHPMNQALQVGCGRYLVQLNPDTLVLPEALDRLAAYMDAHPAVGICGPKVLNRDLSLQKPCRRGESRPWAVISYFSGLASLFPHSRFFSEYLMSYMPENQIHPVAGVSGSCMLIRREVVEQIGYLDERFFAYQEDADYCFRARQSGWQVCYVPTAHIIHYGGMGGSGVQPFRTIVVWHKSYYLYYRKNFSRDYPFLFNWFFYLAMFIKLIFSLSLTYFRRKKLASSQQR